MYVSLPSICMLWRLLALNHQFVEEDVMMMMRYIAQIIKSIVDVEYDHGDTGPFRS